MILGQRDAVLIRVMVGKHETSDQLVALSTQDLRDLAEGNQVLLLRLLEALEVNRDRLTKGLGPSLTVVVLLHELAKDLRLGTEGMGLLAHQKSIDRRAVEAGAEEDALTEICQILHERLERLLGLAGIVNCELAGNDIELLQIGEALEVGCRRRLQTCEDLGVAVRRLQQRFGHVTLNEERGRQEVRRMLFLLLEIANTGALPGRDDVGLRGVHTHDQRGLGALPLEEITRSTHTELQQGITRLDRGAVQVLLDPIVEAVHVLENPITRIEVVAVVQVILHRIVGRNRGYIADHLLGDGNVDVGPD